MSTQNTVRGGRTRPRKEKTNTTFPRAVKGKRRKEPPAVRIFPKTLAGADQRGRNKNEKKKKSKKKKKPREGKEKKETGTDVGEELGVTRWEAGAIVRPHDPHHHTE